MTTEQFYKHIKETLPQDGKELIIEFFFAFSRFECALKTTNFASGNADHVQANWNKFVKTIRQEFNEARTVVRYANTTSRA